MQTKTKSYLARAALSSALLLAGAQAFAQLPADPIDSSPNTGPWPLATASPGNGPLILTAFDPTRNLSVVQYLGFNYQQILPGTFTAPGADDINFTVDGWSTFGGNTTNVVWSVTAVDYQGPANSGRGLITTGPLTGFAGQQNAALSSGESVVNTFLLGVNGTVAAGGCGTQASPFNNPCIATTNASALYPGTDPGTGLDRIGTNLAGNLIVNNVGSVGGTLGFFQLQPNLDGADQPATSTTYGNAFGQGTWTLTAQGLLTYSLPGGNVVPLPGAIWLLLSGLAGVGAISRRGKTAA